MRLFLAAFLLIASALSATPIAINGLLLSPALPTELVSVPFSSGTGVSTTNQYDTYVQIDVSGFGQSLGSALNDAFYLFTNMSGTPVAPANDANYYQLRVKTSALAPFQPQYDIKYFVVYDVATGLPVTAPYVPAYAPSHNYSFVLHLMGPSPLYFGVSDGNFGDNSGSYSITVTQLLTVPEPSSLVLAGLGILMLSVNHLRKRRAA